MWGSGSSGFHNRYESACTLLPWAPPSGTLVHSMGKIKPTAIKWEQSFHFIQVLTVSSIISSEIISRENCHTLDDPPKYYGCLARVSAKAPWGREATVPSFPLSSPAPRAHEREIRPVCQPSVNFTCLASTPFGPQGGRQAGEMCPKPGSLMLAMSFFL